MRSVAAGRGVISDADRSGLRDSALRAARARRLPIAPSSTTRDAGVQRPASGGDRHTMVSFWQDARAFWSASDAPAIRGLDKH